MNRELEPCGTPAAYQRHRKSGEPACDDCKAAHSSAITRRRRAYKGRKARVTEMDRAIAERPPVIVWEKRRNGIMVAVEVHDPHGETSIAAQAERLRVHADRCDREEAAKHAEAIRLQVVALMEAEAAAERNNSPLMTAARMI